MESQFRSTEGLLAEIVTTRNRLFSLNKVAVRGVAKLQNSCQHLDSLIDAWREVIARIDRGELTDFHERSSALYGPAMRCIGEAAAQVASKGIVGYLQEFDWENMVTWGKCRAGIIQ